MSFINPLETGGRSGSAGVPPAGLAVSQLEPNSPAAIKAELIMLLYVVAEIRDHKQHFCRDTISLGTANNSQSPARRCSSALCMD
jgi:hypothetical protein